MTVDFSEIKAIEVRCPCGGILVIPVPKLDLDTRAKCPGCGKYLWDADIDGARARINEVFKAVSNWQAFDSKSVCMTFSLIDKAYANA